MTKINKVGKSTFVIAILSLLLVAVLAFGGTYAYFSAKTQAFEGDITMGALYVDLTDEDGDTIVLGDIEIAQPNQEILNEEYVVNLTKGSDVSTINAFVRVKVEANLTSLTVKDGKFDGIPTAESAVTPTTLFTITAGDGWYQHTDGYAYYVTNKAAAKDAIMAEVSDTANLPLSIVVNKNVGNGGSTFFMGATGTYSITVEAIQADYLDDSNVNNTQYTVEKIAEAWGKVVDGSYVKPAQN